jgi:hypothetical protein
MNTQEYAFMAVILSRRRRSFWQCFVLFFLLIPTQLFSGHGFMTAFGNIEWLPDPGRTPDSAWYRLDTLQEEGKLFLAGTAEEKTRLCLAIAREKLAEMETMVKAENATAAETAADRYRLYIERARQIVTNDTSDKESLAEATANALLEHQYILSVIYEDLPASTRTVIPQVITSAQERYQDISKLLSAKRKGALFFKEEEVRWSVQMATRNDEGSSQEPESRMQESE